MASTAISSTGNPPLGVRATVRYRGFVLIPQADFNWLVRPERSPMHLRCHFGHPPAPWLTSKP